MTEEEKGTSAWYKVPTWDGNPSGFRTFKREMEWWKASLDPISCAKFTVSARWTLRQTGLVRSRAEEFTPKELEGKPAITSKDPQTGEDVVIDAGDPFAGLDKLMSALEDSLDKTPLDKKGDLRKQFYQDLRRQAGERISSFCSRFRTLVGEMKREGIQLPDEELGWFLRSRMGLDAIRVQLLDTALMGKERYDEVEAEALRLFRELHSEDPLHRQRTERAPLLHRFLSSQGTPSGTTRSSFPSSSASSMAGRSFRSSSSMASQRFVPKPKPAPPPPRSTLVAEGLEEDVVYEPEEEELIPDDAEQPHLEEILQTEAEVLAAEIEAMEEDGVDPGLIDGLERGIDQAAESLVTMREARNKINEIKRDRGYGKMASAKPKMHGNQVAGKKSKTACWDCGESGHWAGDDGCPTPGAGAFKPKAMAKKPAKQVRVTEALNTEHVLEDPAHGLGDGDPHEVMVTQRLLCPSSLTETLAYSHEVCQTVQKQLAEDKQLVGALDSACNRTCSGHMWIDQYLSTLASAPQAIKSLVKKEPEEEIFRFGDGGVQTSQFRYRIPMVVGNDLILTWVSVVPVASLGLLLGRDWLDGIGCVLSFAKKVMRADHLSGKIIPLHQILAGHFAASLIPSQWPSPGALRWRRVGLDGVLELQISHQDWLHRRLSAESYAVSHAHEHEHLVTEQSLKVADVRFSGMSIDSTSSLSMRSQSAVPVVQEMCAVKHNKSPSTSSTTSFGEVSPPKPHGTSGSHREHQQMHKPMEKIGAARCRKSSVARPWIAALAGAAAVLAMSAVSLSFGGHSASLESTVGPNVRSWSYVQGAAAKNSESGEHEWRNPQRLQLASRSIGHQNSFPGRSNPAWTFGSERIQGIGNKNQSRSNQRRSGESPSQKRSGRSFDSHSATDRTSRRSPNTSWRLDQTGHVVAPRGAGEDHHRPAERENPTSAEDNRGFSPQRKSRQRWPPRAQSQVIAKAFSQARSNLINTAESKHLAGDGGYATPTRSTHSRSRVDQHAADSRRAELSPELNITTCPSATTSCRWIRSIGTRRSQRSTSATPYGLMDGLRRKWLERWRRSQAEHAAKHW